MTTRRDHDVRKAEKVAQRALESFEKVLALDPERLEAYEALSSLHLAMGEIGEGLRVLQRGFDVQHTLASRHELDKLGIRFISPDVTTSIGSFAFLDAYIKAGILGMRPQRKSILLVRPGHGIPNNHLLNYWRKYVTVISDPIAVARLLPLVRYLEDPVGRAIPCDGKLVFHASASVVVFKQWEDEKRPPLLRLSTTDRERGQKRLKKMGLPQDAWFVGVHVREAGFKDGDGIQDLYRKAEIETYLQAIEAVVARGGWVIRMGNPMMKALPVMGHVVDYALSEFRSDWMDVFLCAQSRFLVNSSSGISLAATGFGTPAVLTNFLPTSALPPSSQDFFIPKLCWSEVLQRNLNFSELMSAPVNGCLSQHLYERLGLKPQDNTAEEIRDLVIEVLDRLDGVETWSSESEELQSQFKNMTALSGTFPGLDGVPINCRMGKDFLETHADLLSGNSQLVHASVQHSREAS